MATKKNSGARAISASKGKSTSAKGIQKNSKAPSLSKSKLKSQSRSTKSKIEKLNANINEIDEIRTSLSTIKPVREIKALDAKELKSDFKRDTINKELNKKAEQELTKQLDLISNMGL